MAIVRRIARGFTLYDAADLNTGRQAAAVGADDTISLLDAYLRRNTQSGKVVTVESAFSLAVVFAAIRTRSDTVGSLPLRTYFLKSGGGRQDAFGLPQYRLLHDQPNPEQVAIDTWGTCETHLSSWGESFIGKTIRSSAVGDAVEALWPVKPELVRVERKSGVKRFWIRQNPYGSERGPYTPDDIIHIKGMSIDGLRGISPLGMAAEAVGAGLAIEEYLNRFYSNSAIPAGVLTKEDGVLSPEAATRLKTDWESKYRGVRKSGNVAVLEDGLKFSAISLPARDAQFVETIKLNVTQVAMILRVPPSLLWSAVSDNSLTYRTVEGDNLAYLTHGIRPDLVRLESWLTADRQIFPMNSDTSSPVYCEFLADALLRTDTKSRYEAYRISTGGLPWARPSEIRPLENMNPDDGIDEWAREVGPGSSSGSGDGAAAPSGAA